MIKRIKVHSVDALKDPNYRFPLNYGVEKFLELFSGEYFKCRIYYIIKYTHFVLFVPHWAAPRLFCIFLFNIYLRWDVFIEIPKSL